MAKGEVREIEDESLANSLLQPHFIEKVEEAKTTPKAEVKAVKKIKKNK